jgi:hypothetical protein
MLLDDKQKEIDLVKNILNTCLMISKQLRLYGPGNQLLDLSTSRLLDFFESYFLYHEALQLNIARHGFIYDEAFIEKPNNALEKFAYTLFQHGTSAVTFQPVLAPRDIHTFLMLTNRPPSESWEEGGLTASLRMRNIEKISVREMSESDLAFSNEIDVPDRNELLLEKSPIWDRFAFAVYHGLAGAEKSAEPGPEQVSPGRLAILTNRVLARMSLANQQKFSKGLSSFLASIQFEKVSLYRKKALVKLTEFINRISPEVRQRLFTNIFNLNMKPVFTEEFFSGLSDEIIIELLENSSQDEAYTPPLIMKVLGKIARDKKLNIKHLEQLDRDLSGKKREITKLFQKDDFEKYVPDKYRETLLNIIQHDSIPMQSGEKLAVLKKSLEDSQQEKHATGIILKILRESPDRNYLKGLGENLVNIVHFYLEESSYQELKELWKLFKSQESGQSDFLRLEQMFASAEFTGKVLNGVVLHGKSRIDEIESLVVAVGAPFVGPLLDRLADEAGRTNRMYYLKLLQQLNKQAVVAAAVKHLDDPRWFFVRNITHILRNMQDPGVMPYLKPLARHPHLKVRTEALRACLQYGCNDTEENLLQMLNDKDPKTVDTAISLCLRANNNVTLTGKLISLLQDSSLFNYRFDQKKEIIKTLAEIAPKHALPIFFDILASKSLIHPSLHEQLKGEIIRTFERYNRELLVPALRQFAPKTSTDIQLRLKELQQRMEP